MINFSSRLKELRREKDITGEELGNIFSVTKTAVSYWESGRNFPGEETVSKIADYFGVSTDYLLGKSEIRNPYQDNKAEETDRIDLWLSKTDGYKELPEEDRELISNLAKNLLEKHRKEK